MQQPIRVGLVHDHRLFSEVMMASLHEEKEFVLVADAILPGTNSVLAGQPLSCDVMLVDATMVRMNATQVTRAIKRTAPTVQVIALGVGQSDDEVLRFIEAGANGYIHKTASYAELLDTIKAVYHGCTPCSPRIAALVFARIAALARQQPQSFPPQQISVTRREREVLQLIALGYRNGEIARYLDIALDTVKRHVANIFKKLQVHGRRAMLQRAHEYGLLTEMRSAQPEEAAGR